MLYKFHPVPRESLNDFPVPDVTVTPASDTPLLSNKTTPAPEYGGVIESRVGFAPLLVDVSVRPFPLLSTYMLPVLKAK
jgi:hypothetical protein